MEGTRLNRFISEAGVASRRAADRLVEEGRVTVNGRPAVLGDRVSEGDVVRVDGRAVTRTASGVVVAFNKPRGLTCTSSPDDPDGVVAYIGYPRRIYSIGRLDKDSEGLLLLTDDGDLADAVMRSRAEHEKEYLVTVDHDLTDTFLDGMAGGVEVLGRVTKECEVSRVSDREFRIVLRQGLNRQIRRMCGALGYAVVRLVRVRVMSVELGDLPVGAHRELTREEATVLRLEALGPDVRPPSPGDVPRLADIGRDRLGRDYISEADFDPAPGRFCLAAYAGVEPVGFALCRDFGPEREPEELALPDCPERDAATSAGRIGLVDAVAVSGEASGRGVGTALVGRCLEEMAADGCAVAVAMAWVRADGPEPIAGVLGSHGFSRTGPVLEGYWNRWVDSPGGHDCPVCGAPCRCSAALWTRPLRRRYVCFSLHVRAPSPSECHLKIRTWDYVLF